ncbi:hypothetical protein BDR05DRAFT_1005628 [Suillus weaverae]|nr:hypothetical protein BDR05DRAFT_1005628 [Suillus weaverae]
MTDRIEVSSGSVSSGDSNSNDGTESYVPSRNMFQNADKEGHTWDITANLLENLLPIPNAVHTRGSAQLEDTRPPLQGYDIPDSSSVRRHPNNEETPQLQQLSRHNSISHHGRSLVGFATVKDKGVRLSCASSARCGSMISLTHELNLELDEVGVPWSIAMNLTYPKRVTPYNIAYLQELVHNSPITYPGARYVTLQLVIPVIVKSAERPDASAN